MTDSERLLWNALRANRLHGLHFRRQQVIDGFIVDFYCHGAGLGVEVDGPVHARQPAYDAERDQVLAARGLRILRVTNEAVNHDLAGVLARITAAALGDGDDLSPQPPSLRGKGKAAGGCGSVSTHKAPPLAGEGLGER